MISIKHLEKQLKGTKILKDISMELPKGYIMGLIGPNGAGKTTLLHVILGLYRADEGSVRVLGCDPAKEENVRNEIGYVLAEELFAGSLSLLENARLYGKFYSRFDEKVFLDYCKRFELRTGDKLARHSKGEKMKFQFAFALAHAPKLLVLDEPTSSFDPEFRDSFLKIITGFIADGEHSVILATHQTRDLDRVADYVTLLDKGEVVFTGERTALEDGYRLLTAEDYKIRLLPQTMIVGKECTPYGTRALVRHRRQDVYDSDYTVAVPSLEEIMYYTLSCKE